MAARETTPTPTPSTRLPDSDSDSSEQDLASPFVGRWNRLISTTNWEKGRIICEWREALADAGAAASAYSDEAWAERVGGVSGQHVGRLRRVYLRVGQVYDRYEGLYWSHFQASLDWDDAEMWLEGAIQNGWSVSQMRGKRWETVGPGDQPLPPEEGSIEEDEDGNLDRQDEVPPLAEVNPKETTLQAVPSETNGADDDGADDESLAVDRAERSDATPAQPAPAQRLPVDVDDLPDDVADAFESFKLAIITHRQSGWSETTPEAIVECLEALKTLALRAD